MSVVPVSRNRGFTLIELLVAFTLFAFMAVASVFAVRIALSSWKRATEAIDANRQRHGISDLLNRQVSSIYALGSPRAAGSAPQEPIFEGTRERMQFLTLSALRLSDTPGLRLVAYEAAKDSSGSYSLLHREERYLGPHSHSGRTPTPRTTHTTMLAVGLSDVEFEYFDAGARGSPSKWTLEWTAQRGGRLPAAISISYWFRDRTGFVPGEQIVVPVHARSYEAKDDFIDFMRPEARPPQHPGIEPPRPPSN